MVADSLVQDIRYAVRTLRRAPLFAATVIVTMGVGLGLLGSAFTILNAYLLKPIDLPDPHALYSISWDTDAVRRHRFRLTDYESLRTDGRRLAGFAAVTDVTVMQDSLPTRGLLVSGNYFDVLGARPALGRLLRPDDATARGERAVVVLSLQTWRARYGSNPAILGERIALGRQRFEVVGVAEPQAYLTGQEGVSFWAPLTMAGAFPGFDPSSASSAAALGVVGRRHPDVSAASMRSWLELWLRQRFPAPDDDAPIAVRIDSLATRLTLDGPTLTMFVLIMSAFGLVLLVASANVTNLMLARALARQPEIAVRLALGASRWRLARQLIVESLVLAVPAAAAGLGWVVVTARVFPAVVLATFPSGVLAIDTVLVPLEPDVRVMAVLAGATVVTAILITLAPAGRLTGLRLAQAARGEVATDTRGSRLRSGLVAMQIAACALFIVGATALLGESSRLANPQPNLSYERVSLIRIDPTVRGAVASRLAADALVAHVAVTSKPPGLGRLPTTRVSASRSGAVVDAGYAIVSPEYFDLFDIQVVRGRRFTAAEAGSAAPVVLVSAKTAAALWPGLDPLGQTLDAVDAAGARVDRRLPRGRVQVIGITEDVGNGSISEGAVDTSCVYFAADRQAPGELSLLVRTQVDDVKALQAVVTTAVNERAPEMPVTVVPMRALLGLAVWVFQAFSVATSMLGAVGLLFAYSGTHAVVSFAVAQRTREFGVRMALGASAWRIIRATMLETSRWALAGVVVGLAAAAGLIRLFSGAAASLPDVGAGPYMVGGLIVLVATGVAALLPLSGVTRIDPARALRTD